MQIVKYNDPALKTKAAALDVTSAEDQQIIRNWHKEASKLLKAETNGVGLAANQTGLTRQLILLWPGRQQGHPAPMLMINPSFEPRTRDHQVEDEGCLSYPGVRTPVKRFKNIEVLYQDENFEKQTINLSGFSARVFQHEFDHIQGVCLVGDAWRKRESRKV